MDNQNLDSSCNYAKIDIKKYNQLLRDERIVNEMAQDAIHAFVEEYKVLTNYDGYGRYQSNFNVFFLSDTEAKNKIADLVSENVKQKNTISDQKTENTRKRTMINALEKEVENLQKELEKNKNLQKELEKNKTKRFGLF